MHNTIPLTILMMLTAVTASAQFYTITKESEISGNPVVKIVEMTEIKEDSYLSSDSIQQIDKESGKEENSGQNILNGRKSDDYKSPRPESPYDAKELESRSEEISDNGEGLAELTIPNLLAEIKKNNIKYPKIVLAQAILETGWFKSSVCRNKHNLFGLTNPHTKTYYEFNHWTESVKAYYDLVQHRYKGGNYLLWLDKIGYAEEKTYIRALIRVLRQL
ncbi:MAG: glucosaminidase domain-containing protein [Duncaniella sp.]|uniref:glucosaminidase domain-containing protein n=1 Tax=Duncaniella sp. TaxID=2518496 RepID=UPI0023D35D8F|nr:glucosaminidase domain-containing protein [Duncaniella sp.]MDE6089980.1 glucosaminidase domain-containing protein [Duncaniella sp.]